MKLEYPFEGKFRLTQKFRARPSVYKKFGLAGHDGVDFACPNGTKLLAPMAGKTYVGWAPKSWGLFYSITNDWGTVYLCHLKENYLPTGVKVETKQLIGETDNTGFSTGPHLHIGLRVKGIKDEKMKDFVDPLPYLEKEETVPDTTEEKQNGMIITYKKFIDDLNEELHLGIQSNDFPEILGRIRELKTIEGNYIKFVEAVAQGIGCPVKEETAVREELKGFASLRKDITKKKLADFGAKEKIISGIIDILTYPLTRGG